MINHIYLMIILGVIFLISSGLVLYRLAQSNNTKNFQVAYTFVMNELEALNGYTIEDVKTEGDEVEFIMARESSKITIGVKVKKYKKQLLCDVVKMEGSL